MMLVNKSHFMEQIARIDYRVDRNYNTCVDIMKRLAKLEQWLDMLEKKFQFNSRKEYREEMVTEDTERMDWIEENWEHFGLNMQRAKENSDVSGVRTIIDRLRT